MENVPQVIIHARFIYYKIKMDTYDHKHNLLIKLTYMQSLQQEHGSFSGCFFSIIRVQEIEMFQEHLNKSNKSVFPFSLLSENKCVTWEEVTY